MQQTIKTRAENLSKHRRRNFKKTLVGFAEPLLGYMSVNYRQDCP